MAEKKRKKKHFIAVLGTGLYQHCIYYHGEQECGTKFVQEAVLKLACGELCPGDRITICLTEDARKRNWEDRLYTQKEIADGKGREGELYRGLRPILDACIADVSGVEIEVQNIATGKNDHEIAGMFTDIYGTIGEEEEIYFDITHGLRNIPMLMMAILEYAKVTKRISIGGIYYGAYEVSETDSETREKRVPVYDLTFYYTILSWANAANSFIEYGHANEIEKLAKEEKGILARNGEKNFNERSGKLDLAAGGLLGFTKSIETGRGRVSYEDSVLKRSKRYIEFIGKEANLSKQVAGAYYPLMELLRLVDDKMSGFQGKETNFEIGMATVDWCVENHLVQQGFTALEETVKTFLCEMIGLKQEEQEKEFWREAVVKRLCTGLYRAAGNGPDEMEAGLASWQTNLKEEETKEAALEKGKVLFEILTKGDENKKLLGLLAKISAKRNDISHFGFTKDTAKPESLEASLKTYVEEFREIRGKGNWKIQDDSTQGDA